MELKVNQTNNNNKLKNKQMKNLVINTEKELKAFADENRTNIVKINDVKFGELYPMLEVTNKHALYYNVELQCYKSLYAPFNIIVND